MRNTRPFIIPHSSFIILQRSVSWSFGGSAPGGPGFFYPATVLSNVPDDAKMLNEEIFGPVAAIQTFISEDEVVARANDTEYGLVAYLYTADLSRGLRVSEKLDFGMIGLNRGLVSDPAAPFGGVKQSGLVLIPSYTYSGPYEDLTLARR